MEQKTIFHFELVPFDDLDKPVVYRGKVYKLCFRDNDGDCILKDDITGVVILPSLFSGNEEEDMEYNKMLIEELPDHPFNEIKQILHNGSIMTGPTRHLQSLIDLYYQNKI